VHELITLLAGRRGHFRMESGYHSDQWFELDRLLQQRDRLRPFVSRLARRLAAHQPDAVCGPMTGGAKLAEHIAAALGVPYLFAERIEPAADAPEMFAVRYVVPDALRETVRGKSVAIVDDAISAGSAVRGTHADLVACGARPVAIGALFAFGGNAASFCAAHGLALEAIAAMEFPIWAPAECPLCRAGVPFERVSDAPPVA
jgi:orotate phosphoribosyltransferase